jgi:hypothetical protein
MNQEYIQNTVLFKLDSGIRNYEAPQYAVFSILLSPVEYRRQF